MDSYYLYAVGNDPRSPKPPGQGAPAGTPAAHGRGEYGEPTIALAASLAAQHTLVTAAERHELLALPDAMDMPTDPIAELNGQG